MHPASCCCIPQPPRFKLIELNYSYLFSDKRIIARKEGAKHFDKRQIDGSYAYNLNIPNTSFSFFYPVKYQHQRPTVGRIVWAMDANQLSTITTAKGTIFRLHFILVLLVKGVIKC